MRIGILVPFTALVLIVTGGCSRSDEHIRAEVRDEIDVLVELLESKRYDEYLMRDKHISTLLTRPTENEELIAKMKAEIAGDYGKEVLGDLRIARSRSPEIRVNNEGTIMAIFSGGDPELFMHFEQPKGSEQWKVAHLPR